MLKEMPCAPKHLCGREVAAVSSLVVEELMWTNRFRFINGCPRFRLACSWVAVALFSFSPALAESSLPAVLAPTPPMGWNSWDSYGPTVREEEVKANADFMAKNLAKYGWQYVIVDIEWYQPNPT